MDKIRVTVWHEFRHERHDGSAKDTYPNGIHAVIKEFLDKNDDMDVRIVCLDDEEQGLPDEVLNNTDVLLWWGHGFHWEVKDELVDKIVNRVNIDGMGFIGLHSAHHSKPFRKLLGCTGNLEWGESIKEIIWNLCPTHPIAEGIPKAFELECDELYSEPFFIPKPDDLIFGGWFEHGNIFRSGATWTRGLGKIFYFQPGHEDCRSFYNPYVQRIITNAVRWAKPADIKVINKCPYSGEGFLKMPEPKFFD